LPGVTILFFLLQKQQGGNMKQLFCLLAMGVFLLFAAPVMVSPIFAAPAADVAAAEKINVNTATSKQLQGLPGIGAVTAQRMIDYRTQKGPFASAEDLLQVKGIGSETLAKIRNQIVFQ
jgi:competence protein ComEA